MIDALELLIAGIHHALPLGRVVEVVPRVEITRIPELAPPALGFVAYRGEAVAAVDMRRRLGYPPRPPALSDHLVIAHARRRRVALVVDRALGVRRVDPAAVQAPPESAKVVAGILPLDGELLLFSDLDEVLSLEEDRAIAAALQRHQEEQA